MRAFLLKHVDVFGPLVAEWQDIFRRCYALVCTTCFDDGLDRTLLVPFAHCMNHSHQKDTTMYLINTKLHLDPLRDKSYFNGPKFLTNATVFYENNRDPLVKAGAEKNETIKGFQVSNSFIAYNEEKSIKGWLKQFQKDTTSLWDLVFIEDEHKWDDNDEGDPHDAEEGAECNPIGKLLESEGEDEEDEK
jgi:hypothetical protein